MARASTRRMILNCTYGGHGHICLACKGLLKPATFLPECTEVAAHDCQACFLAGRFLRAIHCALDLFSLRRTWRSFRIAFRAHSASFRSPRHFSSLFVLVSQSESAHMGHGPGPWSITPPA